MKTTFSPLENDFATRRGQAMLEYLLVFAALLALTAAAIYFARAPRRSAKVAVGVVSSENL